METNIYYRFIFKLLALFFLASCSSIDDNSTISFPITTPTIRPHATPDLSWENNWLNDVPCKIPCFMGITPGRTTVAEALKVLSSTTQIDVHSIELFSSNQRESMIYTTFLTGEVGPFFDFTFGITPTQTIQTIYTNLSPLSLQDVVARFGEPTDVVVTEYSDLSESEPHNLILSYSIDFIYREHGMIISAPTSSQTKPTLDPTMIVGNPTLLDPNFERIKRWYVQHGVASSSIIPWQGWKDIDFYCRNAATGEQCQP